MQRSRFVHSSWWWRWTSASYSLRKQCLVAHSVRSSAHTYLPNAEWRSRHTLSSKRSAMPKKAIVRKFSSARRRVSSLAVWFRWCCLVPAMSRVWRLLPAYLTHVAAAAPVRAGWGGHERAVTRLRLRNNETLAGLTACWFRESRQCPCPRDERVSQECTFRMPSPAWPCTEKHSEHVPPARAAWLRPETDTTREEQQAQEREPHIETRTSEALVTVSAELLTSLPLNERKTFFVFFPLPHAWTLLMPRCSANSASYKEEWALT